MVAEEEAAGDTYGGRGLAHLTNPKETPKKPTIEYRL
jgi:hypothetical protein